MYIPISYWGASNLCISASGGDDISYFSSGSTLYKIHAFTTPGNHTYEIHSGSALHKLAIIGAGGSGGASVDLSRQAGGGGAGGFLFLDNLQISSGSYDIYVGEGFECNILSNWYTCTTNPSLVYDYPQSIEGESSSFQYTFTPTSPDPGYYIPSSYLSAYGGGAGASQYRVCIDDGTSQGYAGTNGASGGGGSQWGDGTAGSKDVRNGRALFNSTELSPHGFNGGTTISSSYLPGGTGGGGAENSGSSNNGATAAAGGGGVYLQDFLPYSGSVCFGGKGGEINTPPQEQPFGSGSGGVGVDGDIPTELPLSKGKDGMVLVFYPICTTELRNCTTYEIGGGVSGGNITYIPCGESEFTSSVVIAGDTLSICSFPITSGTTYPSGSGTVTVTAGVDCDTYVPPTPTPTPDVPCDCRTITFTAGSSGGVAKWYECGVSQSSYNTDQYVVSQSLSPFQTTTECIVSGSFYAVTGIGSTQSIVGTCTSSLPLCIGYSTWTLGYSDTNACTSSLSTDFYTSGSSTLSVGNTLYTDTGLSQTTASLFNSNGSLLYFETNTNGEILSSGSTCPQDCREYRFTAGGSGGTATYTLCNTITPVSTVLSALQSLDVCIDEDEPRGMTGAGASITFLTGC